MQPAPELAVDSFSCYFCSLSRQPRSVLRRKIYAKIAEQRGIFQRVCRSSRATSPTDFIIWSVTVAAHTKLPLKNRISYPCQRSYITQTNRYSKFGEPHFQESSNGIGGMLLHHSKRPPWKSSPYQVLLASILLRNIPYEHHT